MYCDQKTIYFLIAIAILIVVIFRPYQKSCNATEPYINSLDDKFYNPRTHPDSKHVVHRPDSNTEYVSDNRSFKVYDHTDKQRDALALRNAASVMKKKEGGGNLSKRVRFADSVDCCQKETTPHVRHIDIETSFDDTQNNNDRVLDSNNISGYCVNDECVMPISNKIDYVLNMDDDAYHKMMTDKMELKTYVEIDPTVAKYDRQMKNGEQDIRGIRELTNAIAVYRDNTLDTIMGGYRGANCYQGNVEMYS